MLLDLEVTNYIELCNKIIHAWIKEGFLTLNMSETEVDDQISLIKDVLYAPKLHLIRGKMRRINEIIMNGKF